MSRVTQYAPVLAKIGAEKSKLLSEAKIKSLAENKNLAAIAAQLRDTSYQTQIAKVPLPLTSRNLERALNENLIETYVKMIKNSPKKAANFLSSYILRFEVENLKTLIKATNARLGTEEKLSKIYFSAEDFLKRRLMLEEAAKASTLKQMQNSIKDRMYAPALSVGMKTYEENGSTSALDILLDKVFYNSLYNAYEALPRKEKPHARFYAATENDSFTILTVLRGKALNYDANKLRAAVPPKNFKLKSQTVEDMLMAPDFESATKVASETYYGKFFAKTSSPDETLAAAEKAFKRVVFQHAKAFTISELFNVGGALAFMTLKEAEVRNLIAASVGVEGGINTEHILGQMLL
ncbi:MAG: V-type ATPase subunit [Candidatus Bathyarchaeia archaeon]